MTLQEILAALLHHWKLILFGAVFTGVVALGMSFTVPPTYEATSTLAIVRATVTASFEQKLRTTPGEGVPGRTQDLEARRKALTALVKSASIAQRVVEQLGDKLPEELRQPSKLVGMVEGESQGDAIAVHVRTGDPELAAVIANAWAREYEKQINSIYGTTTGGESLSTVQAEAEKANQEYLKAQATLEKFLVNSQINELERQLKEKQAIIDSYVDDTIKKLANNYDVRRKLLKLIESARAMREQIKSSPNQVSTTNALPLLLLKAQAFASTAELPGELQIAFDSANDLAVSPQEQVKDLDAVIAALEQQIRELDKSIEGSLNGTPEYTAAESLTQAIIKLEDEVDALKSELEAEQAKKKEFQRARDLAWEKYDTLATKVTEVDIASSIIGSEVRFASPALAPTSPVSPKKKQNALLGLFAGLILAMGLVLIIEHPAVKGLMQTRDDKERPEGDGSEDADEGRESRQE